MFDYLVVYFMLNRSNKCMKTKQLNVCQTSQTKGSINNRNSHSKSLNKEILRFKLQITTKFDLISLKTLIHSYFELR